MSGIALLPRILGILFYYAPSSEEASASIELLDWSNPEIIAEATDKLCRIDPADLTMTFSVLFEGQGPMAAPPWGSVYTRDH